MQKNTLFSVFFLLIAGQLIAQLDTLQLIFPTTQIASEEQVCVDVKVANFKEVAAMQFAVNWNEEALALNHINIPISTLVPYLTSKNFGMIDREQGILRFSWLDESLQSVSLADSTTLFELCFIGLTPNTESALTLLPETLPTEVFRADLQNIPVTYTPGNIAVGERNLIIQETELSVESMTLPSQSTGCVNVRVNGFDNIDSVSFKLTWDPELFQPEDSSIFNDGVLEVAYSDVSAEGLAYNNNDILHQTCFVATGEAGDRGEVRIEEVYISSTVADIVNITVENAIIEIGAPLLLPVPIDFYVTDSTVKPGATFCVDIMANNFSNIVGMQHALLWDSDLLAYKTTRIGRQIAAHEFSAVHRGFGGNGELIVVWRDDNFNGTTIPVGMPIYQVCFEAKSNIRTTTTTAIRFGQRKPYPAVILQRFGGILYQISQVYQSGTIEISNEAQQRGFAETISSNRNLIYPNPAKDVIYLDLPIDEVKSVLIIDMLGREMRKMSAANKIEISDLEAGNYFLQIKTAKEIINKQLQIVR